MVPSLIFKLMSSLAFTPGKDFEILDKSIANVIFLFVTFLILKVKSQDSKSWDFYFNLYYGAAGTSISPLIICAL